MADPVRDTRQAVEAARRAVLFWRNWLPRWAAAPLADDMDTLVAAVRADEAARESCRIMDRGTDADAGGEGR